MTTKIKLLRQKREIPQFHVARSIGISCGKLSQIESGRYTGAENVCLAIAEHYGIVAEEYFDFTTDNKNAPRGTAILYENS